MNDSHTKKQDSRGLYSVLTRRHPVTGRPTVYTIRDKTPPQSFTVDFRISGGHLWHHDGMGSRTPESCGRASCTVCSPAGRAAAQLGEL